MGLHWGQEEGNEMSRCEERIAVLDTTTPSTRQCKRAALPGLDRCWQHTPLEAQRKRARDVLLAEVEYLDALSCMESSKASLVGAVVAYFEDGSGVELVAAGTADLKACKAREAMAMRALATARGLR